MSLRLIASIVSTALLACPAFAVISGFDNVSNYSGAWTTGSNGGSNLGAWSLTSGGGGGHYIGGTGQGLDSFGLFSGGAGGGDFAQASRGFTGGSLSAGDSFKIDLGSTAVSSGGKVGLNFADDGAVVWSLVFVGGGTSWLINDGGSNFASGQSFAANTSTTFTFIYEGGNNYSYNFGSGSGSNFTATNNISGIDGFELFTISQGAGENFGANDISVVPEPSTYALIGGLLALGVVLARRRFRS